MDVILFMWVGSPLNLLTVNRFVVCYHWCNEKSSCVVCASCLYSSFLLVTPLIFLLDIAAHIIIYNKSISILHIGHIICICLCLLIHASISTCASIAPVSDTDWTWHHPLDVPATSPINYDWYRTVHDLFAS